MPNDAKLGLVLGIGLVIAVGVVFFREEAQPHPGATAPATAAAPAKPAALTAPNAVADNKLKDVPARPAALPATPTARRHTVEEGDTLSSLAERYLGDGDRAHDIFEANRKVLTSPDELPVGTELLIPTEAQPADSDSANP